MEGLGVTPDIELAPWTDIPETSPQGKLERIGLLRNGTSEGRAMVGLIVRMPDGTAVVAETTWRLFNVSARALAASPIASEQRD
ncbi:MAG TPA: hypothetical protein VIQ30_18610 [Pseudonocardia sp.]